MTALTARLENTTDSLRRLKEFQSDGLRRLEQLALEIDQKAEKAAASQTKVAEVEQALAEHYRQIAGLDQEIERGETDYAAIDARLKENDGQIYEIKDRREKTLEQFRLLELEQAQRKLKREHIAGQLEDRYQTPFAELSAQVAAAGEDDAAPDLAGREAEVSRLRTKIARIGDVNRGAIKEYQQLHERHDFLQAQKEDLEKAIEGLHQVIRKINTVSQERFMQTFLAINEKLAEVFPRLFNGGTAVLVLTYHQGAFRFSWLPDQEWWRYRDGEYHECDKAAGRHHFTLKEGELESCERRLPENGPDWPPTGIGHARD